MANFVLEDYHRDVPSEEMLGDLRAVARKLGRDRVTIDEYKEHGKYHPTTLQRRFGSWFRTLDAAKLQRTRVLGLTEEEFFVNLENVWERLGRQPRRSDLTPQTSRISRSAYVNRFGTWRKALSAFVSWAADADELAASSAGKPQSAPHARDVNLRMRFKILQRDRFRCVSCGRSPATHPGLVLHVDHIVPVAKEGKSVEANLQTLCSQCNLGKSDQL